MRAADDHFGPFELVHFFHMAYHTIWVVGLNTHGALDSAVIIHLLHEF